ncbi:MAG TPA: TolC family protein, partial [Stenomitos sp.]
VSVIGTLTWKLLDSGRQAAQVDQARLEAERVALTLQARQEAATLDLETARAALLSSEERIRLTRDQLATAQEALHLARLRFEGGVGTSLEVIQALTALNQAQTAAIAARFDQAMAVLKLGQVLATPVAALLAPGGAP